LHESIAQGLHGLGDDFAPGQLAYLAATRKFEEPVRDALAWRLHQAMAPQRLTVSREYPLSRASPKLSATGARADIAILDRADVVAVIELKALYTFNVHVPKKRDEYRERIAADLKRVAVHVPQADAYAVALTTHVSGDIPVHLLDVVKYARDVRSATKKHGGATQLRTRALPLWQSAVDALGAPVTHLELGTGQVWGLDVVVDAWLVGPVPRSALTGAT
jgi:hypothetical protein